MNANDTIIYMLYFSVAHTISYARTFKNTCEFSITEHNSDAEHCEAKS